MLAGLFRETSTLRIGPLVTSMTLRNPTMLAAHALTVDHVSNGRLELGVGAAGLGHDHAATGVPEWSGSERSERFAEWVEIVVRLLDGEDLDFEGRHYRIRAAHLQREPVQDPIPLTVAALGTRSLEVAARYATTWNSFAFARGKPISGDEEISIARARNRKLDEICLQLDRDPASIARSYLSPLGRREPLPGVERFAEVVGALKGAGMTDVIFGWPDDETQADALAGIAEALPELRKI